MHRRRRLLTDLLRPYLLFITRAVPRAPALLGLFYRMQCCAGRRMSNGWCTAHRRRCWWPGPLLPLDARSAGSDGWWLPDLDGRQIVGEMVMAYSVG